MPDHLPQEHYRILHDLHAMLTALPTSVPNRPDSITQYLIIQDRWSIPDIIALTPDLIKRRQQ